MNICVYECNTISSTRDFGWGESFQDVVRIDQTIKKGELNKNEVIMKTFNDAKSGNGRLHLAGLISDGGVVSLAF